MNGLMLATFARSNMVGGSYPAVAITPFGCAGAFSGAGFCTQLTRRPKWDDRWPLAADPSASALSA
jgi:hypothetical protein